MIERTERMRKQSLALAVIAVLLSLTVIIRNVKK